MNGPHKTLSGLAGAAMLLVSTVGLAAEPSLVAGAPPMLMPVLPALAQRQSGRPSERLNRTHGVLLIYICRIPRPSANASENENASVSENTLTG